MKKRLLTFLLSLGLPFGLMAGTPESPADSLKLMQEQIEKSLTYETGKINLGKNLAIMQVPAGYRYLSAKQSQYVLSQLWGNPPDSTTLGMLFPENQGPFHENSHAIEISYSEEGYIDDSDAKDLDYTDLLTEMQSDVRDGNPDRVQAGYPKVELVGWASPPFYDANTHKLHWAKELNFENSETNTLNYNIRILGRKGYLVLNVIGDISVLPAIKKNINPVLASVDFTKGNRYRDFNPDIDEVAAYGVGGLIAGKVLAKVGFFALFLKFWKVIIGVVMAAFYYIRKKFFGEKATGTAIPDPESEAEIVSEPVVASELLAKIESKTRLETASIAKAETETAPPIL